jgi:hypothetical protein
LASETRSFDFGPSGKATLAVPADWKHQLQEHNGSAIAVDFSPASGNAFEGTFGPAPMELADDAAIIQLLEEIGGDELSGGEIQPIGGRPDAGHYVFQNEGQHALGVVRFSNQNYLFTFRGVPEPQLLEFIRSFVITE